MTIGELAREFGLSRGTLLHYDAVGLLKPSRRSESGYRIYGPADAERLRQVCVYRSAGVPLADIRRMLNRNDKRGYIEVLRRRLAELSNEIGILKRQQGLIVRLLAKHGTHKERTLLNKEQWIALMRATGLNDDDMERWHKEFEKMSGAAHEEFLVSLGIPPKEVQEIRAWSRK